MDSLQQEDVSGFVHMDAIPSIYRVGSISSVSNNWHSGSLNLTALAMDAKTPFWR